MALRDAFADLLDAGTPANPANSAKTRADTGPQPDLGACESLRILRIGAAPTEKIAGFADIRKPENGPQTRANARDSQDSQHSQGVMVKTCAGCSNRLKHGTCGEPVGAGLAPKFTILWPPAGHAATCPAFSSKTPTPAPVRPFRLSKGAADLCHTPCWDDAEIATFVQRTLRFIRVHRLSVADADDLGEALLSRDRDGDDRRSCAECVHGGRAARCPDGSPLPVGMLHRCESFKP